MTAPTPAFVPFVVGIGGTARGNSTTERAVMEALRQAKSRGARTEFFNGAFVSNLPLYNPDRQERTPDEVRFIAAVRQCHGVIVGSPGYHGSISGPIKNALDLIEDIARDTPPYLDGKAFGCIASAYGWQGAVTTLVAMRSIAHALRAWPTPFGAALNASTALFDAQGACIDTKVADQLSAVAEQVVNFSRWRAAAPAS